MTIDQTNVVDFIGVDPRTDKVLLLITDHLEWGDDDEFNKLHMFLLQEKVNGYLGFIESGDIYKDYPKARGKEIIIRVVAKYTMSHEARLFFEEIKSFLLNAGYRIEFEHLREKRQ
jgi:hypothetical protein